MVSHDMLTSLYRLMYTIRSFEERCVDLCREGKIRGYFHPYTGEEAIAAGVCSALGGDDTITSTHRGHGHCIARGADIARMVAEVLGKKTGYCRGLGGSMHIADFSRGNLGANGIVGGGIPMAAGAALSAHVTGQPRVSVVFLSDGASNNGIFAETLNLAGIWRLPLLVVIENNHYAVSTPVECSTCEPDLYKRGAGYGIEGTAIDGNDVTVVHEHALAAAERCRSGKGPFILECKTFRHGGHHVNDPGDYMPRERLDAFKARDPLTICRTHLERAGGDTTLLGDIETAVDEAMNDAIRFAEQSEEMSIDEFNELIQDYE